MAVCELPSRGCRSILEEVARNEGFNNYELIVKRGSDVGENYLGEVFRVTIEGDEDEPEPLHLIMKISLKLPVLREDGFIQGIYEREAYIYETMLPALYECQDGLPDDEKFEFAKYYGAILDETDEILMLEDMCHKGYRMLDRIIPFNYDQLALTIKTIARYHAACFVLRTKKPKLYEEIYKKTYNYEKMVDCFGKYVASAKNSMKPLIENEPYEEAVEGLIGNVIKIFNEMYDSDIDNDYSVLVHGDMWTNNLLFREKDGKIDKLVMIDWQMVRNASPVIDLSYIIMMSIDSQVRSKHYNEMLDLYYETLSSNILKMGVDPAKCYPRSVFREQVRKYMTFGVVVATSMLPATLTNKENVLEHTDVFEHFGEDEPPTLFAISERSGGRLKGIFKDCLDLRII